MFVMHILSSYCLSPYMYRQIVVDCFKLMKMRYGKKRGGQVGECRDAFRYHFVGVQSRGVRGNVRICLWTSKGTGFYGLC